MSPIFSVNQLDVRYPGGVHAVREVTLALRPGRTLALLGANGAGKSSFIGALLGMTPATGAGEILGATFGKVPQRLFEKIGFVADGRTPPGHWTLDRYLAYLRPLYPTWDDKFADELVRKFALPRKRKMSGFSRGMKMKAAMVGALAFRPALLVLDEPFGGLDPLTREELIDGLLDLMEGGSWSMLLSSHDIHEVERLSDEVAILENGRLVVHEELETLQRRFRRWSWTTRENAAGTLPAGWLDHRREDRRHTALQPDFISHETTTAALAAAFGAPPEALTEDTTDLRGILIAHLRRAEKTTPPETPQRSRLSRLLSRLRRRRRGNADTADA